MLHARFNLIGADPTRLGDCLRFIEAEVRPGVEGQPGSLGTSLYTDPELGVAVFESFWASRDALTASERVVAPARGEAVRRAAGTVTVERYEVPVFEQDIPLSPAATLRLTRMDVEPARMEDAVATYGDTAVPWLAETEGFCSALLLADGATGRTISETFWQDSEALAASRSVTAAIRVDTAAAADGQIRSIEEYSLVFSSARKA